MKKLLSLLFVVALSVNAQEVINSYHSDITIEQSGALKVKETIVVHAEGKKICQGIYRDFPTHYKTGLVRTVVPFQVLTVKRNGVALPLEQKPIVLRGKRVYMRDGTWLSRGKHTFELEYATGRQVGFFNKHDELFWNVVGGDWMFPILHSSATVHLPKNVTTDQIKYAGYAGSQGSKNKAFKAKIIDSHTIKFVCTRQLYPHQAFSVVIGMPKGSIIVPTDYQKWIYFFQDNSGRFYLFFMLLLVCLYIFVTYLFKKRNEPNHAVIPLFQPPNNFTPGMVSYFVKRGYSSEGFSADIVNMGVYGWLKISQLKQWKWLSKKYELERVSKQNEPKDYWYPFKKLFNNKQTIILDSNNQKQVFSAFTELKNQYEATNKKYFVSGYMVTPYLLLVTIGLGLCFFMEFDGIYCEETDWVVGVLFFLNAVACFVLYYVTKSYTEEGFKVKAHIEGFKLYLNAAEVERLKYISTPPERTPELYEKYLPYAMALDVEDQWTSTFTPVFKRLEDAGTPYYPVWYNAHFRSFRSSGFSSNAFASGLSSSLSSSINASAPGTRSGFSGGSGGGGAGGGGGGGGGGGC